MHGRGTDRDLKGGGRGTTTSHKGHRYNKNPNPVQGTHGPILMREQADSKKINLFNISADIAVPPKPLLIA
jgi:hypothetical protein